jgi:cytochrome c oxidase subunit 2
MILYIILLIIKSKLTNRFLLQGHSMELIWTITPIFILIFLAIPSIKILYITDEIYNCNMTIKAIGHQWYWRYEYNDFTNVSFDSFIVPSINLKINEFRLLDVDNRCVIPFNSNIRLLTTSIDVIHSWTIPSLGIKIDSTPGRLNQIIIFANRPGIYFGQCSEICGTNHRFMPIVVEFTTLHYFKKWLFNLK